MTGVLYISYDGMLEPLGQSQVLGYIERLAADTPIHLISFEKPQDWERVVEREAMTRRIAASGIVWHPLPYHKRPSAPATAYDIAQGIVLGTKLVRRHHLQIIHARSYVPSVMALAIKRMTGARYLFDMRGFWADERVDGGLWPRNGRLYKFAKNFERRFLLSADAAISLTHAAKREIESFPYLTNRVPPITVIPTCADLQKFHPAPTFKNLHFTLGYVGGAGTWYLFDEALRVFKALLERVPTAQLLIVNRNEHEFIKSRIEASALPTGNISIVAADHSQVPSMIQLMSAGLVLVKPVYSKLASAPTKLAEFLGCGVPCLVNSGVGDMAAVIDENGVGVVIHKFDAKDFADAVESLVSLARKPGISELCAKTAHKHFSLDKGVAAYAAVYKTLAPKRDSDVALEMAD